jgi:hypothetical protein
MNSLRIRIRCDRDQAINGNFLENMPFVPVVGDYIKVGGDWKKVVKREIELNNMGWDATSTVELTLT